MIDFWKYLSLGNVFGIVRGMDNFFKLLIFLAIIVIIYWLYSYVMDRWFSDTITGIKQDLTGVNTEMENDNTGKNDIESENNENEDENESENEDKEKKMDKNGIIFD
jgi:amino acid permease